MDNSKIDSSLDITNRFALDVHGFDAMRAAANASPQQGVKMAAKQFDAVFTQMMLKSMREATPDDGPLDSRDASTFMSMLDQQLSQQMSNKGIGVANAMLKQLTRSMGGAALGADGGEGAGTGGIANALSGLAGSGAGANASPGNLAMLNALGRAYGNAAANGALANGRGYGGNSALMPAVHGNGDASADAFVDKLANAAQQASASTGIPARFIIGQAALESGWGKREIKKADGSASHNVFGIKASKDWTGKTVSTVTTEYVDGEPHRVVAKFRAYDSYEDAMADYATLLKSNPRYASVINNSHSAESFAHGMQRAGYATDPHYAQKLLSVMQQVG